MPTKSPQTGSAGFSAEERAAMKQRAAELRAEGKKGAKKADGLQAVLDSIAAMAPEDRALAERVHVTVTGAAPQLSPKTWYGMPAYANADGKVVVFFQDSASSSTATRRWAVRTQPTSTTAPCGRWRTRCRHGAQQ
jgi:uncharacterized protein YdhG (YjbR/CyaY superfamily)